jgi:putative ABC transport system substrate-binding protein
MRRRDLLALLAVIALPEAARAQKQAGKPLIAYLGTGTAVPLLQDAFRQGLREAGWVVGDNVMLDMRHAEGQDARLRSLASELILLTPDVIVASPTPAALAVKSATDAIPIVGIGLDNPIRHGLIASLPRPGGNVTGLAYSVGPEIFGKDLELLRALIPEVRRVAVLSNSTGPNHAPMLTSITEAAQSLGLDLRVVDLRHPEQVDAAFARMVEQGAEALFVFGDPLFSVHRALLAGVAARNRLPTMYTHRLHVESGGLMSYGPVFSDLWRRAASYVDRILKGAKPADLPVEQPTRFELVINLKTARALDLTVPRSLLARADEVIE